MLFQATENLELHRCTTCVRLYAVIQVASFSIVTCPYCAKERERGQNVQEGNLVEIINDRDRTIAALKGVITKLKGHGDGKA